MRDSPITRLTVPHLVSFRCMGLYPHNPTHGNGHKIAKIDPLNLLRTSGNHCDLVPNELLSQDDSFCARKVSWARNREKVTSL